MPVRCRRYGRINHGQDAHATSVLSERAEGYLAASPESGYNWKPYKEKRDRA